MVTNLVPHMPPGGAVASGPIAQRPFKAHIHALTFAEVPFVTLDFIEFGKELGVGAGGLGRHGKIRGWNVCKRERIPLLANAHMEFSAGEEKGMTSRG